MSYEHKRKRKSLCSRICLQASDKDADYVVQIPGIIADICNTLAKPQSADHVDSPMIPSKSSLIEIIDLMETILYPGYYGEQGLDKDNYCYYLGFQVNQLYRILSEQIARCLIHECSDNTSDCACCALEGKREAIKFLHTIPELRNLLASDILAAFDGDPAARSKEEIVFCYPGLKAITIYRFAHILWKQNIPILPRMLTEHAHSQTGTDIHPGADIGKRFFIDHATGVVIGETTVIGKNVRIYQGVTLGALSIPKGDLLRGKKRHPTIEDDVVIYANATILGGETVIGKGSIIGGNVWITSSVPAHSRVVLEAPKQKLLPLKPKSRQ